MLERPAFIKIFAAVVDFYVLSNRWSVRSRVKEMNCCIDLKSGESSKDKHAKKMTPNDFKNGINQIFKVTIWALFASSAWAWLILVACCRFEGYRWFQSVRRSRDPESSETQLEQTVQSENYRDKKWPRRLQSTSHGREAMPLQVVQLFNKRIQDRYSGRTYAC